MPLRYIVQYMVRSNSIRDVVHNGYIGHAIHYLRPNAGKRKLEKLHYLLQIQTPSKGGSVLLSKK